MFIIHNFMLFAATQTAAYIVSSPMNLNYVRMLKHLIDSKMDITKFSHSELFIKLL